VLVRLSFVYGFVLSTLTAMTLVGVSVSVERGHPAAAGWLEAAVAVGSMAGGALVSRGLLRRWTLGARLAGMCLSAGLLVVVTALAAPLPSIAAALALTGGWIAPSLAVHGAHVLAVSGPGRRAEAFGWVSAAGMATNSLATPGVGVALDSAGAPGGAGLAMAAALLGCALSAGLGAVSPPPGHDPSV
jgi:hypothetical protein